jgi:polyisoprenoid-binding protein YceI
MARGRVAMPIGTPAFLLLFGAPACLLTLAGLPLQAEPITYQVDPTSSSFTIHVGKAGLFSFAGHDHEIHATGFQGTVVADSAAIESAQVQLTFPSSGLQVDASREPEGDAPKVQEAMQGPKCLEVARFPEIRFASTQVVGRLVGDGSYQLRITGELDLHGVRRSITFPAGVKLTNGALGASGKLTLKQKDFGIEPFSAGGGTVKVKNELAISFSIAAKATAATR